MKQKTSSKISKFLIITICTIILVVVSMCSCTFSNVTDPSSGVSADNNHTTASNDNSLVLVDDKIKVTYMGCMDASSMGVFYVTLKVENNTDADIVINLEDADVDGETIPLIATGVPLVVRPGNSGQTGFIFPMANLSISSMSEAEKATFRIVARDNTTFDTIYESELLTVNLQ